MAKAVVVKKPPTKTEIMTSIAGETGLSKKQVAEVFESLAGEIKKALSNRGAGAFVIPGLIKIEKKKVAARPAQKGVPNPFKPGELMDRPAKPAYNKVKVRALKNLKGFAV
jgi:nucleoid DNA-binding protein